MTPAFGIRPIRPADGAALERYYETLTPDSRWSRFFDASAGLSHQPLGPKAMVPNGPG